MSFLREQLDKDLSHKVCGLSPAATLTPKIKNNYTSVFRKTSIFQQNWRRFLTLTKLCEKTRADEVTLACYGENQPAF